MDDSNASGETAFPWLPGEAHCLPDPSLTYRDDPEPPEHLQLTLALLARGATPLGDVPAEWLPCVEADAIRALARQRFGRGRSWNNERDAVEWHEATAGTAEEPGVIAECVTQRCWAVYAQLVCDDLAQRGETPAAALDRIPSEWRQWRLAEFITKWRNAAPWPPALALSWIMFAGDWERIGAFLENGSYMPNGRPELECLASLCEDEPPNPRAADDLKTAIQLRDDDPKHSKRVIVRGLLRGQGEMVEISPADFATLEWADNPNAKLGAVLERRGGVFYSNVVFGSASLLAAFPGGLIAPDTKKSAWLIDWMGGSARRISMEEARKAARAWLSGRGETFDASTVQKEGLRMSALARSLAPTPNK